MCGETARYYWLKSILYFCILQISNCEDRLDCLVKELNASYHENELLKEEVKSAEVKSADAKLLTVISMITLRLYLSCQFFYFVLHIH